MQTIEILILILVLTIIPTIAIDNIVRDEKHKILQDKIAEYEKGYDNCMELLKRIK